MMLDSVSANREEIIVWKEFNVNMMAEVKESMRTMIRYHARKEREKVIGDLSLRLFFPDTEHYIFFLPTAPKAKAFCLPRDVS